jgi:hypothetical protein
VVVDNSPPVITKLLPSGSTVGTVEFRFAISDSSPLRSVMFRRDGGDWKELTFKDSRGYYYALWPTSLAENGVHVYEVRAVDALGNERTSSYTVSIENKDYSWAVAAGIVIVIIVLAAIVLLSRWKRHAEPMGIETPPGSPTPAVPPAGLQQQAPPMEQRPTSLMDLPPMPPAREGPFQPPSGWVVGESGRTAPPPIPQQAPPAEPPKPAPTELDKLVNDLTK